jgi:hypothetical protein
MSIQMHELSVVREDSPIIEDLARGEDEETKSSPRTSPVQITSPAQTPEGALEGEEEHQEPWRRLLQPPDYVLMQNDLPSTSYGLVCGRQRFGITKYSHPSLLKSYDASSDSSSCHYHWCYRAPIGSTGSNLSDDVFSVSPLGGGVKMVQFDDLYADSDSETLTTKKKRRKSSTKSEDKHKQGIGKIQTIPRPGLESIQIILRLGAESTPVVLKAEVGFVHQVQKRGPTCVHLVLIVIRNKKIVSLFLVLAARRRIASMVLTREEKENELLALALLQVNKMA